MNRPLLGIEYQLKGEKPTAAALEPHEFRQFGNEFLVTGKDELEAIFEFEPLDCLLKQMFDYLSAALCEFLGRKRASNRAGMVITHSS